MMTQKYKISTEVLVRFSDTDAMGHVNNARMFSYMEEGRVSYFKKVYPHLTLAEHFDVFPFILAQIDASFVSPAYCGETLIVSLGVKEFGNKSFTMGYNITEKKSQRLVSTGSSVLVMYDYRTKKSFALPQELKDRIAEIEK